MSPGMKGSAKKPINPATVSIDVTTGTDAGGADGSRSGTAGAGAGDGGNSIRAGLTSPLTSPQSFRIKPQSAGGLGGGHPLTSTSMKSGVKSGISVGVGEGAGGPTLTSPLRASIETATTAATTPLKSPALTASGPGLGPGPSTPKGPLSLNLTSPTFQAPNGSNNHHNPSAGGASMGATPTRGNITPSKGTPAEKMTPSKSNLTPGKGNLTPAGSKAGAGAGGNTHSPMPFGSPARSLGDVGLMMLEERNEVDEEGEGEERTPVEEHEAKVALSERRYMMRKRASEMPYVDWSLDLIGGQLLIYLVTSLALIKHDTALQHNTTIIHTDNSPSLTPFETTSNTFNTSFNLQHTL